LQNGGPARQRFFLSAAPAKEAGAHARPVHPNRRRLFVTCVPLGAHLVVGSATNRTESRTMLTTRTHPSDDDLNDFVLGKLPDLRDAELENHLADCPECQERAAATRVADTLVELLASAGTRFDARCGAAPTPTPTGAATPSLFVNTPAWNGTGAAAPAPAVTTEVPAVLVGHPKYRAVQWLGEGGMGTIWLAEHTVMNRPVAIKVIRPELLARPGATDRFLREVRAAAKLHHPNIVTAFDAEPTGGSCLLVLEYVDGETLADRLRAGPLPVAEACRAARDAARGLAHAHAAGLVHRDVKPHNLIRAADGTVKVLDFGLAGAAAKEERPLAGDGLTGAGMVCGTPDYIAPEQATDPRAADARADIYGLGCTLYHLLAGHPLFPTGSVTEKLAAQEKLMPEPIPNLAPDLGAILAKMLAKRPEDRYQTADEVVTALEGVLARAKHGSDTTPRKRRKRWVVTGAALVLAALVAAAGVVFKIQRDNQEITIATDDPDIEVVMKRKGEVVRVIDKKSGQVWELDTVTNQIGLADAPDGLRFELPQGAAVVIRRKGEKDGKPAFTITRAPAAPRDRELLLGTWEVVAAEGGGQPAPQSALDTLKPTITFTPEKFTAHPGAVLPKEFLEALERSLPKGAASRLIKGIEGVYHLDPSKAPKTIDLTVLGDELRRSALGLYSLEGDTLKVCLALNPENVAERPTEFSSKSKGGTVYVVVTFKRREKAGVVEVKGRLLPVEVVRICPPREGQLRKVRVKPGEKIDPGHPCITFYSRELEEEYGRALLDLVEAKARVAAATELLSKPGLREADRLSALIEKKTAETRAENAVQELRALELRYNTRPNEPGFFSAVAPPGGAGGAFHWTVLTDEFREDLAGRTIRPSEEVLRVGHLEGAWHVKGTIPRRDIGPVLKAFDDPRAHAVEDDPVRGTRKYLVADVRLASQPDTPYEGRLYRDELAVEAVTNRGEGDGTEPVVTAFVTLDASGIPKGHRVPREQFVVGLDVRIFLFRVPEAPAPRP
jgi:uncharacterized protein (TIGR03067 family)